jgi:hypothetical protein
VIAGIARIGSRIEADCPYRIICAADGGCHSPNRTSKLKQFAAQLESGE